MVEAMGLCVLLLLLSVLQGVGAGSVERRRGIVLQTSMHLGGDTLMQTMSSHSLIQCAVTCVTHYQCLSFDFHHHHQLCHLHGANSSQAVLVEELKWIHGDLDMPDLLLRMATPSRADYSFDLIPSLVLDKILGGRTCSLVLLVRTCRDAILLLTSKGDGSGGYKDVTVELGSENNTHVALGEPLQQLKITTLSSPSLLHCHQFRSFWLDWSDGMISTGKGNKIRDNVLVSWQFPGQFELVSVGISTHINNTGEWLFFVSKL